jgi:hypothetical protein
VFHILTISVKHRVPYEH